MAADKRTIPDPPRGRDRLKWLGPSFLRIVSAAGSGELLYGRGRWTNESCLQRGYVIVLLTLLPIGLYLVRGEPVKLGGQQAEEVVGVWLPH